jgi:hypothetical protein
MTIGNDGIDTRGIDPGSPRELELSVYHAKGGPEKAKRIRVRPVDASDRLPSTGELKELILVKLGQVEAEAFDVPGCPAAARKATSSWRLRNVTKGEFVPDVDDASSVIARGDVLELMDRGIAGGDGP